MPDLDCPKVGSAVPNRIWLGLTVNIASGKYNFHMPEFSPKYLFALWISAQVFYFVGRLIVDRIQIWVKGFFPEILLSSIIGHLAIISLLAIILTLGKTILILIPTLFVLIKFLNPSKELSKKLLLFPAENRRGYWLINFLLIFSLGVFTFKYVDLPSMDLLIPAPDYISYGFVSDYLLRYQHESKLLPFGMEQEGLFPYHYLELWFGGIIGRFFSLPETFSLVLVVYPYYFFLIILGALSIGEGMKGSKLGWIEIAFFLLVAVSSGIFLTILRDLPLYEGSKVFAYNPLNYHKLQLIQAILMLGFYFILVSNKNVALMLILVLPILFISTLVPILVFMGIILLGWFLIPAFKNDLEIWPILFGIGFLLLIPLFYFFLGQKGIGSNVVDPDQLFNISTRVNIVIGTLIRHFYLFLFFLPLLALYLFRDFSDQKVIKTGFLLLISAALLSWVILFFANNSIQLFSNLSTPLLSTFLILAFAWFYFSQQEASKIYRLGAIGIIIFFSLVLWVQGLGYRGKQVCDKEYAQFCIQATNGLNPVGAYIKDGSDYQDHFSKIPTFSILGRELGVYDGKFFPISLSVHETPIESNLEKSLVENSIFYQFADEDISASQLQYVTDKNVEYLFITKNASLPSSLESLFYKAAENSCSGEKLFLRK